LRSAVLFAAGIGLLHEPETTAERSVPTSDRVLDLMLR
jgi:hypothetical protein